MRILTYEDVASPDGFKKLPQLAQLALAQTGKNLFSQILKFLETGGIMVLYYFKRPAPYYLEAIERMREREGLTINAAVTRALTSPSDEVRKANHQFLTVDFIPKDSYPPHPEQPGNPAHFASIINSRLDEKVEEDLARLVLLREVLTSHSREIFKLIGLGSAAIAAFEILESALQYPQIREHISSFLPAILFSLHFLNKFFFPLLADFMTFYGQLKPWLKGENFFQETCDLLGRHIFSKKI